MKPGIHPTYHPVVFTDGDIDIVTRSTRTSSETREINGVMHYVIPVDISSYSHPYYTGTQRVVDAQGRVERFKQRYKKKNA